MNLLGAYNDDAKRSTATGTQHVSLEQRNFGEFKVPSLRNLESSMPYMHNGSLATLRDVVKHYSEINPDRLHSDGEAILKPLRLTDGETADLVAFLQTLSDGGGQYQRRPFPEDCR
jgi:cytochrome c peroxidase